MGRLRVALGVLIVAILGSGIAGAACLVNPSTSPKSPTAVAAGSPSTSVKAKPTTTSPKQTVTSPKASTAATNDPLKAWCQLRIGEGKVAVLATMGAPRGSKVATYLTQSGLAGQFGNGTELVEWDVGNSLLAATFIGGKATNLQAYDQAVGPAGATNIACAPFRH
jgi:hypothetical protein